MDPLRSADYRALLSFVGEVYARRTISALGELLVDGLGSWIRVDVASVNWVDMATGRLTATDWPPGTCSDELRATLARVVSSHPVISHVTRTQDRRAHRLSDFISLRQFRSTEIYAEIYAPLSLRHELSFTTWPQPASMTILGLDRSLRDFSDREHAIFQLLAPHVDNALRIMPAFAREINLDGQANLTPRECEIMQLVANGATNPQIGRVLRISARTVQKHLEHIYGKLNVTSRTGAAQRVISDWFAENEGRGRSEQT